MLTSHILFYLLVALLSFTFLYKTFFIYVFLRYKDTIRTKNPHNNSIYFLICVKNESKNLNELLVNLQNHQLPAFPNAKCYIINDHSTVHETNVMASIVDRFPFASFHQSTLSPGKKKAIRYGYNLIPEGDILLLDADCRTNNENWSINMTGNLQNNEAVVGYGPFYKEDNICNKLIRFECMYIAAQYMGYTLRGMPYMGVGRNMAVKKSAYEAVKSKVKGEELLSGDDDLLIQSMHENQFSIGISTNPDTFVYSKAESQYIKYLRQKVRQISTSKHYTLMHKLLLASDSASHILFIISILLALFMLPIPMVISFICLKWAIAQGFYMAVAKKLKENDLIYLAGMLEFIYSFHLIILSLYSFVARKNVWK